MFRVFLLIQFCFLIAACDSVNVVNKNDQKLVFTAIKSDYKVTDRNNYGCEKIDETIVKHTLQKGVEVTDRDIHDYFSTSGCTVEGSLIINDTKKSFSFDYGGYIYIGDELIIGCAKKCCENNFKYCTWESNGLK